MIPLAFFRGLPLVQVAINDAAPAWFLLDTASTWSFLDVATAETLEIATSGNQTIRGGGDTVGIMFATGVSLTVGGVTRRDDHVAVMRLPFKYDRPIAGILGSPFLTQFVVTIDYQDSDIAVTKISVTNIGPAGSREE